MSEFEKYRRSGAYHWRQVDPHWSNPDFNPPLSARYEALIRLLPKETQTILDVGCGDGYLLYLAKRICPNALICGLDNERLGLRLSQEELWKHGQSGLLLQGNAYQLPFETSSFDVVLMADVIEHLEDPNRALQETSRVLRDKGSLLLSTPNQQPDMKWDKLHVHEYTVAELKALLKKYFTEVRLKAYCPMWWLRQWKAGGRRRQLINILCRVGYNPFLREISQPTTSYGQIIAWCTK